PRNVSLIWVLKTFVPMIKISVSADDLVPCSSDDADFNKCLAKNIQTIFINWKDGISGSDIVGPLDPFTIKALNWPRDQKSGPVDIETDLTDIVIKGMSQATISTIPKLNFNFNYKVKGTTDNVELDTEGNGKLELGKILNYRVLNIKSMSLFSPIGDILMEYEVTLKPRVTPEATFFDVVKIKGGYKEILAAKSDLDKSELDAVQLPGDQQDAFDDHWDELYENLKPIFESTAESMLLDRTKKILSYIPATYIIKNIH
ncbi:hypothetical protein KR044_005723, partial [Drosophila immigrans]